jgi:hypothetical protein
MSRCRCRIGIRIVRLVAVPRQQRLVERANSLAVGGGVIVIGCTGPAENGVIAPGSLIDTRIFFPGGIITLLQSALLG